MPIVGYSYFQTSKETYDNATGDFSTHWTAYEQSEKTRDTLYNISIGTGIAGGVFAVLFFIIPGEKRGNMSFLPVIQEDNFRLSMSYRF